MEDSVYHELRQLEHRIAYHAARADIECFCASKVVSEEPRLWWYDITAAGPVEDEVEWVGMAVRYLELCGLLLREPENPNQVRPLDAQGVCPMISPLFKVELELALQKHPPEEWAEFKDWEMQQQLEREVCELEVALWINDLHGDHGILREAVHVQVVAQRIIDEMERRSR